MKKLIYIIFVFFIIGCKTKQPITTNIDKEKETIIVKDSLVTIDRIKAINDSLFIKLQEIKTAKPECDSITQIALDNFLKQINSAKKSGNNELGFYYDNIKKMLVAYGNIAETINKDTKTNKDKKVVETKTITITKTKTFIPKWVKILAILGAAAIVFLMYRFSRIFI